MREDETDARQAGQVQLAHDRHEVVAVGAQAVQPDDGNLRIVGGVDRDVFQQLAHGLPCSLLAGRSADFGLNALHTSGRVSMYGPPIRSMQ
jgi:hypothetical protein